MTAGDSRAEHRVLHRALSGARCEVVVYSMAATKEVKKIGVGFDRSLFQLRINHPLPQFFRDKHEPDLHPGAFDGIPIHFISVPRVAWRETASGRHGFRFVQSITRLVPRVAGSSAW